MEGYISLIITLTIVLCVLKVYCNPVNEYKKYPIESKELFIPPLEDIVEALKNNLTSVYKNVEVNIVDCPDLRDIPFSLALQGLSGSPTLFEGGSETYLIPTPVKSKVYNFKDVPKQTGVDPTFIIGAGAGPFLYLKSASEIIANLNITDGQVHSLTQIGTVKNGKLYTEVIPDYVSHYSFMMNLFVSQGKPGKVIKVKVSNRIGDDNFPSVIRETLRNAFPHKSVGLGGTFLIKNSRVNIHVQPQFSEIPLENNQMRDDWLVFYNVSAPMVGVGTLITKDPGLDLRPYHFHCLSNHNAAGHYHYDVDKDTVEYVGYFTTGEKVVRVDRPKK